MELLLTHGYFLYEDPKELQIMKPYVPLGILYICSHLRSRGYDVEVFDTTFSSRAQLFAFLQTSRPAVLGIYSNLMTRSAVLEILRVAKQAGWQTVVGGPEPGAYLEEYLAAGADVVVIGEGEVTLEELLAARRAGWRGSAASELALERVHGIAFRKADGSLYRTPNRAQISDIDAQPWPDREAVDLKRYLQTWRRQHGMGSVSLLTARGCPYSCRWCSHEVFGKTHRRRKPASVVDELEWLLARYQPDMAWIADDVFTIHHGWLEQYAAEIKRRRLKLPFECISRADRLNARVMDRLAELGCIRLWIGSESGSQRILDSMQRGVSVEQVQAAVSLAQSRGIKAGMFLMWGYEGEQIEDIEATVEHVKRSDPDIFLTTVSYPIKGTPYFQQVASRLVTLKPWSEGSDRDYRIRGRHSQRFYQFADQLLRSEVELHRLLQGAGFPETQSSQKSGCAVSSHAPKEVVIAELHQKIAQAQEGLRISANEVEA